MCTRQGREACTGILYIMSMTLASSLQSMTIMPYMYVYLTTMYNVT